jgi:hypothetical protein
MHTFMRSIALIAAVAVIGLGSTGAFADTVKDAGSIDGTYVKRDIQVIPDQEGHMLLLTESTGTSSNSGGLVDGFSVTVREIADLRQGNGPQQGYVIYTKGSERQVVKIDGTVTTVMQDGQPKTTFKGKYTIAAGEGTLGIEGAGSYSGYFKSENDYHVDWEGLRWGGKNKAAGLSKN